MMTQERKTSTKHGIHLWEFLLDMLADKNCSSVIDWTNKDNGEFKLKNQEEVAKRWGHLKHRPGMNYDKLSRALRYYYQKGIIKKVSGQRLVYRFCNPQVTVDKKHVTAPKIKEEKTESKVEDDCKKPETTQEENESNAQPVKCHTGCKVHPYTPSFQSHSDSNFGYTLVQTPLVSGGPIGLVPYRYVMPIVIPAHQSVTIIRS